MREHPRKPLGPLEQAVMQLLWDRESATAEEVRLALWSDQELKESTVRTVLSRLEVKGYVTHDVKGRTYIYRSAVKPENVASTQIRGILEKLCGGSVENLLIGMVENKLITPEKLRQLVDRISAAEKRQRNDQTGRNAPKRGDGS